MPDGLFPILILLGVLVTAGALIAGIVTMVQNTDGKNAVRSNKLMQMRIWAQGATILIALIFLFSAGS